MKPPGILPAEDILSSTSTLKSRNVAPGRGASERVAVDSIIVSPSLAVIAPPACLASFPVSSTIERSPTGISRRILCSSPLACEIYSECYRRLPAQAELSDERPVALHVFVLQVFEQPTPLAYHLEQTAARVIVVLVLAQVLSEVRYSLGEHRDLHLRRPRVVLVGPVLPDDLLFVLNYRQLPLSPLLLSSTLGL